MESQSVFDNSPKGAINSVLKVERWRSVTPNSLKTGVSTSNNPRSVKNSRISAIIFARASKFFIGAEGCHSVCSSLSAVIFFSIFGTKRNEIIVNKSDF